MYVHKSTCIHAYMLAGLAIPRARNAPPLRNNARSALAVGVRRKNRWRMRHALGMRMWHVRGMQARGWDRALVPLGRRGRVHTQCGPCRRLVVCSLSSGHPEVW